MADAGITDILISFPLVGSSKLERLVSLAKRTTIILSGDSRAVAEPIASVVTEAGLECDFLVECDVGGSRVGVQTARDAAQLAALVDDLRGLRFAGLLSYPTPAGGGWLGDAHEACRQADLGVAIVSGGGTPRAFETTRADCVTEYRAGTYVFGDRHCLANGTVRMEDIALTVKTTVVSCPTSTRVVVDAGSKTLSNDAVPSTPDAVGFGVVLEYPSALIYTLSEEHGLIDFSRCASRPRVNDVLTIVPNHVCAVVNLHDVVTVVSNDHVLAEWRIAARGLVR